MKQIFALDVPAGGPKSQFANKLGNRSTRVAAAIREHERRNDLHTLAGLLAIARDVGTGPDGGWLDGVEDPLVIAQLTGKLMVGEAVGVRLCLAPDSSLPQMGSRSGDLVTVLGNLIGNAMDAALSGGSADPFVEVSLRYVDQRTDPRIEVRVADNGPGVPPMVREWIFEDGATTKGGSATGHRGLGLALVRRIAEESGGTVTVGDRDGGGAVFTVSIRESNP